VELPGIGLYIRYAPLEIGDSESCFILVICCTRSLAVKHNHISIIIIMIVVDVIIGALASAAAAVRSSVSDDRSAGRQFPGLFHATHSDPRRYSCSQTRLC